MCCTAADRREGCVSIDDYDLAWALVEQVDTHLDIAERHRIHIAIAVGDTFEAVCALLALIDHQQVQLPEHLAVACRQFATTYAGSEYEPLLRQYIARYRAS